MQQLSFRSTWLPLGLAVVALIILNLGLYGWLSAAPQSQNMPLAFPYREDFATQHDVQYLAFGGDWTIRDARLVQISTSGYDLGTLIPLQIPDDQPYYFETTLQLLDGTMGGGVMFGAQQTTSRQQSHMARFNVDAGKLWLIYGYFGDDSNFVGQGSAELALAPDNHDPHRLRVEVGTATYALLLDGTVVASEIPLLYRGGTVGFITSTSQVAFDDIVVDALTTPTPAAVPTAIPATVPTVPPAGEMQSVFSDSFENPAGGPSLWLPISGDWTVADGSLVQQQKDGYDFADIYQQPVSQPYSLRVTFHHLDGSGGGLLFNLPTPNRKNGGSMVRYFDPGDSLVWGYFDDAGNFNGQGNATVSLAGQGVHTLEILAANQSYTVRLDGVDVASGIPLTAAQPSGYFGLTTSQSAVAFDDVSVYASGGTTISDVAMSDIPTNAATGTWSVSQNVITQSDTPLADYVAGTGIAGEVFTISVDILLPADLADAGGGIIFHMDGRDDPRQGYMVRFANGGSQVFWGHYDEQGVFQGEGNVPLTLAPGVVHTLLLHVHRDDYDILVDGTLSVQAVPITRHSGWIGLISFGGPVAFSNVQLQLGE